MHRIVLRERNKTYYRALHLPIWIWVFWVLPGPLTYALWTRGPGRANWIWLAIVTALCVWRGAAGRLPGVEPRPYVVYHGATQPNLPYRVVCYTAAWIDLLVPFLLNFAGLIWAAWQGSWPLATLYRWAYWPLTLTIVLATALNLTPRARRNTCGEGAERAWFYAAVWTVVPTQAVAWAMWRLGRFLALSPHALIRLRLGSFLLCTLVLLSLGILGRLPRTARFIPAPPEPTPETAPTL